jgi:Concanavalin A-like lectin/glucanases superfamily
MWRRFAVLAVLAALGACSFESSVVSKDAGTDVPVSKEDAAIDGSIDTPPPAAFCDPTDLNVVVCYEFEGNTNDLSSHHLNTTNANVSFTTGKVGLAMQFGATSAADVADNAVFDVAAVTLEAWIKPSQFPSNGNRSDVIDMDRQYALFLHADGTLTCALVGGPSITTVANVTLNQWTHVACTYDGAVGTIYIDGASSVSMGGGGPLGTNGTTGISLASDNPNGSGGQLIGLIDNLRLMNVARTAPQICADAGKLTCP